MQKRKQLAAKACLELHLYKGFDNTGVLVSAVMQDDLPVVVNRGERAITIWTCQLND